MVHSSTALVVLCGACADPAADMLRPDAQRVELGPSELPYAPPCPGGIPDTGFGVDGVWTAPAGIPSTTPLDALIQPDGRIVVVGTTADGGVALLRFLPDGGLDPTFGTGGVVTSGALREPTAAALEPDGGIVVAGRNLDAAMVARYHPDGARDWSFQGMIAGSSADHPFAVVVTDVGIVIGATRPIVEGDWRLVLHWLDDSGMHDLAVVDDIGMGRWIRPRALVVDGDGRLVAAAEAIADGELVVARYASDGSRDGSFGSSGVVNVAAGQPNAGVAGLVVEGSGRLIAGLSGYDEQGPRFGAIALQPDGAIDTTYGSGGRRWTVVLGNTLVATSVRATADHAVVIAGTRTDLPRFFAVRITPDGHADGCFASNGYLVGPVGESTTAAIQPDGRLVLVGYKWWSPSATRLVLAGYTR